MRTRFQLKQVIIWKGKHGIYKGKIVGLHDDYIFVREIVLTSSGGKSRIPGAVYHVDFEDVIARV